MSQRRVDRYVEWTDPTVLQRFVRFRETEDRALRNELVEVHRSLAVSVARHYAGRGEPFDDLVQVAMLGLLKAVERFDPELGFPLRRLRHGDHAR